MLEARAAEPGVPLFLAECTRDAEHLQPSEQKQQGVVAGADKKHYMHLRS